MYRNNTERRKQRPNSIFMETIEVIEENLESFDTLETPISAEYIKFKFDIGNLNNRLKKLVIQIRDYVPNSISVHEYFYGILHTLISDSVTVEVTSDVEEKHKEHILAIFRTMLEADIILKTVKSKSSLYKKNNNSQICNNEYVNIIISAYNDLKCENLIMDTAKKVNGFYHNIKQLHHIDTDNYLKYINMKNAHSIMYNLYFCPTYIANLKLLKGLYFKNRRMSRKEKEPYKLEKLFLMRPDGEYNLDYILNLLVKNRNNINRHYSSKLINSTIKTFLEEDKRLLMTLLENWDFLSNFLCSLYKIIDKRENSFIINDICKLEKYSLLKILSPMSIINYNEYSASIDEMVSNGLELSDEKSKGKNNYITNTILRLKNLIKLPPTVVKMRNKKETAIKTIKKKESRFSKLVPFFSMFGLTSVAAFTINSVAENS
ncbi:hypothetical protein NEPAR06_1772 [Nematocida parisii]|nr:hypothetical protein NEPAR07_0562 [Nematocida parisii]KAI5155376.1 hypothetical protein NEPAR06_1772 [Nematocida parisii]KAI5156266.1 hypothetical protein NEPAR05_0427 [Nematocida parisii]